MEKHFNYSNYGNDLELFIGDAERCSHSGECVHDVMELLQEQYVKEQVEQWDSESLRRELEEYGAWSEEELNSHEENIIRWVWISAGDIVERREE